MSSYSTRCASASVWASAVVVGSPTRPIEGSIPALPSRSLYLIEMYWTARSRTYHYLNTAEIPRLPTVSPATGRFRRWQTQVKTRGSSASSWLPLSAEVGASENPGAVHVSKLQVRCSSGVPRFGLVCAVTNARANSTAAPTTAIRSTNLLIAVPSAALSQQDEWGRRVAPSAASRVRGG